MRGMLKMQFAVGSLLALSATHVFANATGVAAPPPRTTLADAKKAFEQGVSPKMADLLGAFELVGYVRESSVQGGLEGGDHQGLLKNGVRQMTVTFIDQSFNHNSVAVIEQAPVSQSISDALGNPSLFVQSSFAKIDQEKRAVTFRNYAILTNGETARAGMRFECRFLTPDNKKSMVCAAFAIIDPSEESIDGYADDQPLEYIGLSRI